MRSGRQRFINDTQNDLFIYLEPWAWRYRVRPTEVFELAYDLKCAEPSWVPLELHVFPEGASTAFQVFVNGIDEPKAHVNGIPAKEDYES